VSSDPELRKLRSCLYGRTIVQPRRLPVSRGHDELQRRHVRRFPLVRRSLARSLELRRLRERVSWSVERIGQSRVRERPMHVYVLSWIFGLRRTDRQRL
jgi:hypothetical protein